MTTPQAQKAEEQHPQSAKQAIVVVHGMGEQRPMDTIKGFVETIWCQDGSRHGTGYDQPGEIWSKPDARTGSYELRRVTTRESKPSPAFLNGVRTDFYELYWADLTAGSPWQEISGWLRGLLLRNPTDSGQVPRSVLFAWICLWGATAIAVLAAVLAVLPSDETTQLPIWAHIVIPRWVAIVVLLYLINKVRTSLTNGFGRVVRYTRATPSNIASRAAVRERGLALLEDLHRPEQKYTRIVIVGHSLGTILAYELLAFFWARRRACRLVEEGSTAFERLCALEAAGRRLENNRDDVGAANAWLAAQRAFRRELASRPLPTGQNPDPRWLISDFVTLGSPLTHSAFLLAHDEGDLENRRNSRELPTDPPIRELLEGPMLQVGQRCEDLAPLIAIDPKLFFFPPPDRPGSWELHHAALFAAVRWTNIWDRARFVAFGDQISGPLQQPFGPGIVDVGLQQVRGQATRFSHLLYWSKTAKPEALDCVRDAVNLLDEEGSDPRRHIPAPTAKKGGTALRHTGGASAPAQAPAADRQGR